MSRFTDSPGRRASTATSLVLAALAAMFLSGCGEAVSQNQLPVQKIEGTLHYNGKPLPGALVAFHPVGGRGRQKLPYARGYVDSEGRYRLSTYGADGGPRR